MSPLSYPETWNAFQVSNRSRPSWAASGCSFPKLGMHSKFRLRSNEMTFYAKAFDLETWNAFQNWREAPFRGEPYSHLPPNLECIPSLSGAIVGHPPRSVASSEAPGVIAESRPGRAAGKPNSGRSILELGMHSKIGRSDHPGTGWCNRPTRKARSQLRSKVHANQSNPGLKMLDLGSWNAFQNSNSNTEQGWVTTLNRSCRIMEQGMSSERTTLDAGLYFVEGASPDRTGANQLRGLPALDLAMT